LASRGKFALLLALLLAGSMWFYVQRVLIGRQQADAARLGIPRGNLSDLYPRWLGARELLRDHRDPYSAAVTREIQSGYYGRPLDPARPNDPKDEQRFAYPVYVVFLLAPTVGLSFPVVQIGFWWLLALLTAASVPVWLRILQWRASLNTMMTLVVLTLGSFPVLQGLKLQQLSLLVAGLIAGGVLLLVNGYGFAAGILLALATIKPQLALPVCGWLLIWALGDWHRRQSFVWGFAGTMAALLAASEYVLPGWMGRFREAISAYREYNGGAGSVVDVLLTPGWGKALGALIVLALAVVCWRHRRVSKESISFAQLTVLVLTATVVVVPKAAPYNQVMLLAGVLLVAQRWQLLSAGNRALHLCAWVCALAVGWPWLAALGLALASFVLPAESVQKAWALPLYSSLVIPVAVLLPLVYGFRMLAKPVSLLDVGKPNLAFR